MHKERCARIEFGVIKFLIFSLFLRHLGSDRAVSPFFHCDCCVEFLSYTTHTPFFLYHGVNDAVLLLLLLFLLVLVVKEEQMRAAGSKERRSERMKYQSAAKKEVSGSEVGARIRSEVGAIFVVSIRRIDSLSDSSPILKQVGANEIYIEQ